jgi:hypothetical protein
MLEAPALTGEGEGQGEAWDSDRETLKHEKMRRKTWVGGELSEGRGCWEEGPVLPQAVPLPLPLPLALDAIGGDGRA